MKRGGRALATAVLGLGAGLAWLARAPETRTRDAPRRVDEAAAHAGSLRRVAVASPRRPETPNDSPRDVRESLAPGAWASDRLARVVARAATSDGRPLAGAAVVLHHGARRWDRAVLDAGGGATFTGLVPGRYALELDAESLPDGLLAALCARSGTPRVPVVLERGRSHAVALSAARAASLRGTVLDARGAPLAHASVRLQSAELTLPARAAESDERGVFGLDAVLPGSYRVHVGWPVDSARGAPPAPHVLALEPGSSRALVVRAEPLARSIRGRLVDAAGRPLAGIEVQCELVEARAGAPSRVPRHGEPPAPWSLVLARARTDAEGVYALAGLPPARVAVRAAPRVGASAFARRRAEVEEALVACIELAFAEQVVDAGTSVLRAR